MNFRTLIAVIAIIVTSPAAAHEVAKGPHGGRVADAGEYHVELVSRQSEVEVYLSGASDKPVDPSGFKGLAILISGGKSQRILLEARESTRLSGKSDVPLQPEPKGVVQITSPDGKTVSARFN